MSIRVGIHGFGRIGRLVLRAICNQGHLGKTIDVIAIVEINADADCLAYQFKYDSVHGKTAHDVFSSDQETLIVNGHRIKCISAPSKISDLPWEDLGVDVVIEATGLFAERKTASEHLVAGAKKVIVTAPCQDDIKTIVMGINENDYLAEAQDIISAASCTTHCLAMLAHVLVKEGIGIESGFVTVINSYTASQNIVDGFSNRDWRSGRAGAVNIIPSTTNSSEIVSKIMPGLKGKLSAISFRVPTCDVSLVDLTFRSQRDASILEIDALMKKASATYLSRYLGYCPEELVSTDFINDDRSAIYDSPATLKSNLRDETRFFRVLSWYDNEWGYSNRVVDLICWMHRSAGIENNKRQNLIRYHQNRSEYVSAN